MKKNEALIGGGILLAIVGAIAYAGRSNSTGTTFATANPQSVAAATGGIAAEIQAANAAVVERATIASQTVLGLAQLQQADHAAQLAVKQTKIVTDAQTAQVGLQSNAAISVAQSQATSQQAIAQINATSNEAIARTNADVAKTVANNQTTQAQAAAGAQKTSSFWNALGNIGKAVAGIFGGH